MNSVNKKKKKKEDCKDDAAAQQVKKEGVLRGRQSMCNGKEVNNCEVKKEIVRVNMQHGRGEEGEEEEEDSQSCCHGPQQFYQEQVLWISPGEKKRKEEKGLTENRKGKGRGKKRKRDGQDERESFFVRVLIKKQKKQNKTNICSSSPLTVFTLPASVWSACTKAPIPPAETIVSIFSASKARLEINARVVLTETEAGAGAGTGTGKEEEENQRFVIRKKKKQKQKQKQEVEHSSYNIQNIPHVTTNF